MDTRQQSYQLETNRDNENDIYNSNNQLLKTCNIELEGINNTIISTENETRLAQEQLDNIEIPILNKWTEFDRKIIDYDECRRKSKWHQSIL